MTEERLEGFPVVVEIPVLWGDMDAFQHVNNVRYFRYFESARVAYFERIGALELMKEKGVGPILGSARCRFKLPLTYPDTVRVGARVPELGEDRFLMEYRVVSEQHRRVAAEGDAMIVFFDYRGNAKASLPEEIAGRIRELEGAR